MTETAAPQPWDDALGAAALLAVDPLGLGGVIVRAAAGPVRDRWMAAFGALLPAGTPRRRIPATITDEQLIGGLDLTATLAEGRARLARGILAASDGGFIEVMGAERLDAGRAARIGAALDAKAVDIVRDGFSLTAPARVAVVAVDESVEADERVASALGDRLAFKLELDGIAPAAANTGRHLAQEVAAARQRLPEVLVADEIIEAICCTAVALGISSLRAPLLALAAARAAAAFDGRTQIIQSDAELAARLVLAPRATRLPVSEADADDQMAPEPAPPEDPTDPDAHDDLTTKELAEAIIAAASAAIPRGLLAQLARDAAAARGGPTQGRTGAAKASPLRGRPAGVRSGAPRGRNRLAVVVTLRAAAPWQTQRRLGRSEPRTRIEIRRDDFRIKRHKARSETATIFVVDASGSSALHRLGEAKGAIELLLTESYARRDSVALIAFRGTTAELLLPPTRALARARRALAALPGGGGTPLAAGLDAAHVLAGDLARTGRTPSIVVLTDGRANIARDGLAGRPRAEADADQAARLLRAARHRAMLIDTSPRPQAAAQRVASEMNAVYMALPHADATQLSSAARRFAPPTQERR